MAKENKDVISFAKEVRKRTGVVLDEKKIAEGTPSTERVRVDPEQDRVVRLAMQLLTVVRDSDSNSNPVALIAALQIVGNTLSAEFIALMGQEAASKAAAAATAISSQYEPEYEDAGQMAKDPEDKP